MNILMPDIPVLEKLVRSAVVDLFLLAAFRLAGKRQLGRIGCRAAREHRIHA